jgi:hypothetical protein
LSDCVAVALCQRITVVAANLAAVISGITGKSWYACYVQAHMQKPHPKPETHAHAQTDKRSDK